MNLPSNESGWVFPTVISSIVLFAALSALLTIRTFALGQLYHDVVTSSALHEALRAQLIPSHALPRGCSVQSATAGGLTGAWWVCSENIPSFETIPPIPASIALPDFDLLLADSKPCDGLRESTQNSRFTSPVSPFTCTLKTTLTASRTLTENLVLDSALIEKSEEHPLALIVSPGYLTVRDEIATSSDLAVVVGGTARIESIRALGRAPVRVTVLSSRGDIEVGHVSGVLSLLVIGRAALRVPPTPFLPPFPLPSERLPTILGLAPYRPGWD